MKVGVVQLNPTIGDFTKNTQSMLRYVSQAKQADAALVVFPELSVCGYAPRDYLDFPTFAEQTDSAVNTLAESAVGITIICGAVTRNSTSQGRALFNSAVVMENRKRVAEYHKQLLPFYDIFDEPRYFEPGHSSHVHEVDGVRFGISICEDVWNQPGFLDRTYSHQPLDGYSSGKCDWLLNLSASPFSLNKPDRRVQLFQKVTQYIGRPAIFCNQIGAQDDVLFDGCSFAMNASGELVARARAFEESCFIVDTDAPAQLEAWPKEEPEWILEALTLGVKDYFQKTGTSKAILGLSGGIDSSVTAAIAARALGPKNVIGVSMPTRFTSEGSHRDAKVLATHLGIEFLEVSIDSLFGSFSSDLKAQLGTPLSGVALENIQPRIRMTVLMAIANMRGAFLLNTSNKSEIATGFATLYGDSAGAIAVLGDLTKHQVYSVAKVLNAKSTVIPESVIRRVPSAELSPNQKDADVLPEYGILDTLVREHIENLKGKRDLEAAKLSPEAVSKFLKMHSTSEFKRRQLPPPLRISDRSFGIGRRIPIAAKYPVE